MKPIRADERLYGVRRVYALIDHREPEFEEITDPSEPYDVFFDCVDSDRIDDLFPSFTGIQDLAELQFGTSIVRFTTNRKDDPFQPPEKFDDHWLELQLSDRGPYPIEHYSSIDHEPLKRAITKFSYVSPKTAQQLNQRTSLDSLPQAVPQDMLRKLTPGPMGGVAFYDIGQGSCGAICASDGHPLVYIDFGGGVLNNISSYPAIRFCHTDNAPIVLSHWDWDHWASGTRDPKALDHPWIVPKQKIGFVHSKLAADLLKRNNLLIWPDSLSSLATYFGEITKCTGTTRNDSGLAVIVDLARRTPAGRRVLFPGDCRYSKISGTTGSRWFGLAATHHGGKLKDKVVPFSDKSASGGLVYSYGDPNSYGHPRADTCTAHDACDWRRVARTADWTSAIGSIARGNAGLPVGFRPTMPCGGRCTLGIQKNPT